MIICNFLRNSLFRSLDEGHLATHLEHLCNLNVTDVPSKHRKTSIICTIGEWSVSYVSTEFVYSYETGSKKATLSRWKFSESVENKNECARIFIDDLEWFGLTAGGMRTPQRKTPSGAGILIYYGAGSSRSLSKTAARMASCNAARVSQQLSSLVACLAIIAMRCPLKTLAFAVKVVDGD